MPDKNEGTPSRTKNRGFASMDPEKQREIASKGGRIAHQEGKAHEFTSEEAREAGRKGGEASHSRRKAAAEEAQRGQEPANQGEQREPGPEGS
jgi:uncharacterized protein